MSATSPDYSLPGRFCGLTRLLAANLDAPDLFDQALARVAEITGARICVMYSHENTVLKPLASVGAPPQGWLPLASGEGLAGKALQRQQPLHSRDAAVVRDACGVDASEVLALPLKVCSDMLGVLMLASDRPFVAQEIPYIGVLADQIAIVLYGWQIQESAARKAIVDETTGLLNRSYFNDRLDVEFSRAFRYESQLSLVLVGIDNFAGMDESAARAALLAAGAVVFKSTRDCDLAARYGDELFAIALPHTNREQSRVVAEKIRRAIAEVDVTGLTVCVGAASYPDSNALSLDELTSKAQEALSLARKRGRDQVVMA